jgi:uncharacterized delta-60 repeat protein
MKDKKSFSKKNRRISFALAGIAALFVLTSALAVGGSLDPSFGTNGFVVTDLGGNSDTGNRIALSSDGSNILALGSTFSNAIRLPVITRYNSDGSLDNSYGAYGKVTLEIGDSGPCDFAIEANGKMVVAANSRNEITLARYTGDDGATPDSAFGVNGITALSFGPTYQVKCSDLAVQVDHKIVMVGSATLDQSNYANVFIARFDQNGVLDFKYILDKFNFPNSRYNYGKAVAIQSDGKIVLSGGMMDNDGNGQISLARLNADGSMDVAFGTNGKGTVTVAAPHFDYFKSSLALQTDGKIVVVGTTSATPNIDNDLVVARFNSNGTLDPSFGIVSADFGDQEEGTDLVIQKDGKIIVAGRSFNNTSTHFLLVRYNANGSLDPTFGVNGKVISDFGTGAESAQGAVLQFDGKLLVIGTSNNNDMLIARYDIGSTGATPIVKTFTSIAAYDGWVLESSETSNVGGALNALATTFNVGDDPRDKQYRGILSFQTKSIPDNAFIASAQLNIKKQGVVGVDPFTTHGDLLAEINRGAFSASAALQKSDFSAPANSAIQDQFASLTSSWYAASLTNSNLTFINKIGVTQFRLRFTNDDNDDMGADYIKFFSGNSADANLPRLIITYFVP